MKPNVTKKRTSGAPTGASTAKAQPAMDSKDSKKKGAMAMQASSAGGSFGARDMQQQINPNKTGGVS